MEELRNSKVLELDLARRKRTRNKPRNYLLLASAVILVIIALGFFFLTKKSPSTSTKISPSTSSASKRVATSSPKISVGLCQDGLEYTNTKQGYKVCFNKDWQVKETKASALSVGFAKEEIAGTFPGTITVEVGDRSANSSLQAAEDSSTKFAFGKETVGSRDATQITFTRLATEPLASYPQAIQTFVTHFGRVYTITLNSTDANFEADKVLYNAFLASWKFTSNIANPPWSNSGNILVNSPWPDDKITSPVEVSGEAIAFEAVLNLRIKDSTGHILVETTIKTGSGQERSPFDERVTFNSTSSKTGTIEVFTKSTKDGSEQDKVIVKVNF